MKELIIYLSVIVGTIIVFSTLISVFQYINKIVFRKEEREFILDLCLIYNNPGSIMVKSYHISRISLNEAEKNYHIDMSKVKIQEKIATGYLTLLNISSTINMTTIEIGG